MKQKIAFVLALAFVASMVACSAPEPAAPPDIPAVAFEKITLDNGLDVIMVEDHRLPMVAVNLWYHVGPANEEPGRTGFAHLFEHMMFQASKHVPPDQYFRILEGAGASDINGTTDFDRTNYFETLPSNQLELALWLESDRMGYLLDVVDETAFANQQDIVRNERRQALENQPYGMVQEAVYHQLFQKDHPYHAYVIGSHADIQAAKLDDVKAFFKQYYTPNNASLAIVGDIDKAEAKKLVEKYFGTFKRGPEVPKLDVTTPPVTAERRVVVQDRVELPKVYMAWLTSPIYQPGDAEADLAARILGGGRSSRLYKKLVYEQQIAQDVSTQQESLILGSVFEIQATARPGHTAEELEQAINEELARFRTEGPTATEIERARNMIETGIIGGLETLGGFGGVADRLNGYNHYLGTPDYLAQDIQRYRDASPESVKAFAADQLNDDARVVVYGVPGEPDLGEQVPTPPAPTAAAGAGAEAVNPDEPWRNEQPAAGAPRPLQIAQPVSFTLSNGLTVILSERPGLPIVSANLVVRTGSEANPLDEPGLANFTAAMLDEGTAARDALKLADDVAQIGASLNTGSSMDASQVTVRSLKKNFAQALALAADVTLNPSFPQAEVDRQRSQRLARILQQRENPGAVANTVMYAALYGPKHPYGYTELGTEAANQSITRDDMVAFWKQNFVPNNAALIVAGQIGADELRQLAEQAFGGWQAGEPVKPEVGEPGTTAARLVIVDKPGAPQTQLRVATIAVARSTPDYPALQVMNMSLGGLFSSRINMNLREEHGYTYGAGSVFSYRRLPGAFYAATGVRTDVTGPAVSEVFKEITRMAETPLTSEELSLAKDSLVRSLPGAFETSGQMVGNLSNIYVYDLGLDYFSRYPERMGAVTSEMAQEVAKKYLDPSKMLVVAVGDRKAIAPQLQRLNLGRTEIRDADGNVVR